MLAGGMDVSNGAAGDSSTSAEISVAFRELLAGLEAQHRRELAELKHTLTVQMRALPVQSKAGDLDPQLADTLAVVPHDDSSSAGNIDGAEQNPTADLATDNNWSLVQKKNMRQNSQGESSFESGGMLQHHILKQYMEGQQRDRRMQILDAHIKKVKDKFHADQEQPNSRVVRWVHNSYFDTFCACMITLNSIFLGFSVNYEWPTEGEDRKSIQEVAVLEVVSLFFTLWFLIEIVLRGLAEGLYGFFFFSSNTRWNIFDSIIVGVDLFGLLVTRGNEAGSLHGASITILRMLRILRVARAIRIIRLVKFFTELRLMVLSIMKSGTSLLWTMVLLSIIIYIFGILIMNIVSAYLAETPNVSNWSELEKWFGSLPRVSYTLFLCISGGISWVEISQLLIEIHWSNCLVISFFIFFTVFSMLNIITGIFVESTLSSVQSDKDEVIREHLSNEKGVLRKLEDIFHKADTKNLGSITIDQFEDMMKVPETHALMATLGLDINEARGMFNLMDTSGSGHVGIEEFLIGCVRMKGGAKAVDLVTLMFENKKLMDMISNFVEYAEEEFTLVRKTEAKTQTTLASLKAISKAEDAGSAYIAQI